MPKDNTIEEKIKELNKAKLFSNGGACFECCDYEGMVTEMASRTYTELLFITPPLS